MKKLCLFIPLLFIASAGYAADLFVQSVKAKIYTQPALGSAVVAEVQKGERLAVLEKKQGWYKVAYQFKMGWVSRLVVGPAPPSKTISVFEDSEKDLKSRARKRASAFATGAAARGLTGDRKRVSDKYRMDYEKLEAMEALHVSDEEALEFLHQGVGR